MHLPEDSAISSLTLLSKPSGRSLMTTSRSIQRLSHQLPIGWFGVSNPLQVCWNSSRVRPAGGRLSFTASYAVKVCAELFIIVTKRRYKRLTSESPASITQRQRAGAVGLKPVPSAPLLGVLTFLRWVHQGAEHAAAASAIARKSLSGRIQHVSNSAKYV